MFDKNFNIIVGDRASGRTNLLIEISSALSSVGYKLCFIGGTTELKDSFNNNKIYDIYRFAKTDDHWDTLMMESIKEITERDKYDFIIVDDLEYLTSRCLSVLKSISVKKIVTSLTGNIPDVGENNSFVITFPQNKWGSIKLETNGVEMSPSDIIKVLTRDKKIKSILK